MKKPKHLELSVKKTKHLELSEFFYGYFKNIEFFCHFFIFQKIWQCLALCFCQGYRLIINGCIKKWLCSKKIQTPWTIRLVSDTCSQKKTKSLKNQIVQGVWIFSRIIAKIFISVINYYTFDKSKHLELSDSILGHSQIFSDTI